MKKRTSASPAESAAATALPAPSLRGAASAQRTQAHRLRSKSGPESTSRRSVIQATDSARSGWTAKSAAAAKAASGVGPASGSARRKSACASARQASAAAAWSHTFVRWKAAASSPWTVQSRA